MSGFLPVRLTRGFDRLRHRLRKERDGRPTLIVLGNQRSGTSAIAHLLADYAGLSKTIDIPEIFWPTIGQLISGELSFEDFVRRHRHRFLTGLVKEPNLTFLYDAVKRSFPRAKYLFVARDPRDNIRSILNRMGLPGNLETFRRHDFSFSHQVEQYWLPILDPVKMEVASDHYVCTLALRWNRMGNVWLHNNREMVMVRYEDFLADKIGTLQRLATGLELTQQKDVIRKLDLPFQPAGDRHVSREDFFGSRNLRMIEQVCGSAMGGFGYDGRHG